MITHPLPPESPTSDHLGRTDKDFAIEFAIYLANAAERYMGQISCNASIEDNPDDVYDASRALEAAIYEFRKRVPK